MCRRGMCLYYMYRGKLWWLENVLIIRRLLNVIVDLLSSVIPKMEILFCFSDI